MGNHTAYGGLNLEGLPVREETEWISVSRGGWRPAAGGEAARWYEYEHPLQTWHSPALTFESTIQLYCMLYNICTGEA